MNLENSPANGLKVFTKKEQRSYFLMSREYGIDPEAINTYETFFQVIPHFGSRHFRYIRRYPKKWSSMVKRAVDNIAPRAKARIIEKLIQIDKELVDCLSD